jgi:hypothetical protein
MKRYVINEDALPLSADLRVAGTHCFLRTNSEDVLASLSRWTEPSGRKQGKSFDLSVLVDPRATRGKDTAVYFRGLHHLVFAILGEDERFVFDLSRHRVSAVVSKQTAGDAAFWDTRVLPLVLGTLGATIGLVPLHCACLDRNGDALLLAGESGTGKSTLAVCLSRHGFAVVSDGWTYMAMDKDKLTAHGISAHVKLLPDAVNHFPELHGLQSARAFNGEISFEVDVAQTFRAAIRCESRPRWLMFLERVGQPGCNIIPVGGDVAQTFFENSVERLSAQLREAEVARGELLKSLTSAECWLAQYGGPPNLAAGAISRFCERM